MKLQYGKRYVPLEVLQTYADSAEACDPFSHYPGVTRSEQLKALVMERRTSEPPEGMAPVVAEILSHVANSQLPTADELTLRCDVVDLNSYRAHVNTAKVDCGKAATESPRVIAHGTILSVSVLLAEACWKTWEQVRLLAKSRPIPLHEQFRLWKSLLAANIDLRQLTGAFGIGFASGASVELLHLYVDRSIACARQLLRALRSAARSLFEALVALVDWSEARTFEEKVAEIIKKLANAGLILAGGLFEHSIEAAVTSVAPWLSPVADLVSAVIIVIGVLVSMYVVRKIVDSVPSIERSRQQSYIDRAVRDLSGFQLHEFLATRASPST